MSTFLSFIKGKLPASKFFEILPKYLSDATTIYIEGANIENEISTCLNKHLDSQEYDLPRETLYPMSQKYRCRFSKTLMYELSELSKRHAEPEILDHMFIYNGVVPLLIWCDAFWGNIEVTQFVPSEVVQNLALELGLEFLENGHDNNHKTT